MAAVLERKEGKERDVRRLEAYGWKELRRGRKGEIRCSEAGG